MVLDYLLFISETKDEDAFDPTSSQEPIASDRASLAGSGNSGADDEAIGGVFSSQKNRRSNVVFTDQDTMVYYVSDNVSVVVESSEIKNTPVCAVYAAGELFSNDVVVCDRLKRQDKLAVVIRVNRVRVPLGVFTDSVWFKGAILADCSTLSLSNILLCWLSAAVDLFRDSQVYYYFTDLSNFHYCRILGIIKNLEDLTEKGFSQRVFDCIFNVLIILNDTFVLTETSVH